MRGSAWKAYKIIPVSAGDHYICCVEGSKRVKTWPVCCRGPDQGLKLTWFKEKNVFNPKGEINEWVKMPQCDPFLLSSSFYKVYMEL